MTRVRTHPLPPAATPPAASRPARKPVDKPLPATLPLPDIVLAPVLTAIGRDDGPMAHSLVRAWLVGQGYPAAADLAINITAAVTVSTAKT